MLRILECGRERMLGGEAVVGNENPCPGCGGERTGVRLIAECRADDVAAAVKIEHGRAVAIAGRDDERRDASRGHRPRDRAGGRRELCVHRLERGPGLDQVGVAGKHASHRLERPRDPREQLAAHRQRRRDCLIDIAEQPPRAVEQGFSGKRQLDAVGGATQELASDELLKASNLPAERRLRDIEPLGRAAEVELFRHGHERPKMVQLDAIRRLREGKDTASLIHAPSMALWPMTGDADRALRSCTIGLSVSARAGASLAA